MYTLERADHPHVELVGRNGSTTLHDTMLVREEDGRTEVDYTAVLTLTGPMRVATPVMSLLFRRLADQTERSMTEALGRL